MDELLLYSIQSFPPLPESIDKLNKLYNAPEIDPKAVARLIESDPILYTDILHYANSPHYGVRHPLTTVSQVISLFGLTSVRGMAIVAALKTHPFTDLRAYDTTFEAWFGVMEKQQRFLELWLAQENRNLLEPLGGLPFILEIGRLVAAYVLMFTQNPYFFTKITPNELLAEEETILGSSGDELACILFELWFFDATLVDSLRHSLSPALAIEPKACAALNCARLLFGLYQTQPFDIIIPILEKYSLDAKEALHAYKIISGEKS
jgi:hypothetical protein